MSSSSDSESDDEEYLLSSTADENREAMIRRKLLQSFYGTSDHPSGDAMELDEPNNRDHDRDRELNDSNDEFRGSDHGSSPSRNAKTAKSKEASVDLDSVNFSASLHTSSLIESSSTHALLTSTNQLSQSIRLLDSTMQTLVYENYSKFISATDAIRSIGQSVDLSDASLDDLNSKMTRMEQNTVLLEDSLKQKRQQVVEKLKLKRLLHRLTGLVELPSTLLALQRDRKYVLLMRNYLDTMNILPVFCQLHY